MDNTYNTVVLKTVDIKQWGSVTSERWETNNVSPRFVPSVLPGESFHALAQGGETETELTSLSELRRQSWSPGEQGG